LLVLLLPYLSSSALLYRLLYRLLYSLLYRLLYRLRVFLSSPCRKIVTSLFLGSARELHFSVGCQ
jgi:hypothetical protein